MNKKILVFSVSIVIVIVAFLVFVFLSGPCHYSPAYILDFTKDCDCHGLLVDTSFSFGVLDMPQTLHCFGIMTNQKCYYLKLVGSTFEEIQYPCLEHIDSSDIQKQHEAIQTKNPSICEQIQNAQVKQDCIQTINTKK